MKRVLLWTVAVALYAALLGGCGTEVERTQGQEAADAAVGGQAAANLTPSPEVVDPSEADAQSQAAGETPSILGSTPEPGQVGGWQRVKLWDKWDVGYPDGWQAQQEGDRATFTGAYGEEQYRVEMLNAPDGQGNDLESWAKADLASIQQETAALTPVSLSDAEALKASNLALPGAGEGACPAARVYGQARVGTAMRIVITVVQTGGECSGVNTERLADALIAEAKP